MGASLKPVEKLGLPKYRIAQIVLFVNQALRDVGFPRYADKLYTKYQISSVRKLR